MPASPRIAAMHVQLLVPDLLSPVLRNTPSGAPRLPSAELLFARGRRQPAGLLMEDWLKSRYGLPTPGDAGLAACSLLGEALPPGTDAWMRADPVHLKVGVDAMMLADCGMFSLENEEAQALVAHLSQHFGDRLAVVAPHPRRWYVRAAGLPPLHTHALAEVRGGSIAGRMPEGEASAQWRSLMNEAQMALHEHPVNQAREARGELPVNSIWLWGVGELIKPEAQPFDLVLSDDPLPRGLATASGAQSGPLPANAIHWLSRLNEAPHTGRVLIVLDALRSASAYGDAQAWWDQVCSMEADWFAPLLAALRTRHIGMLSVHACTPDHGLCVETTRQDLQRFWRRLRPLHQLVTSADPPERKA